MATLVTIWILALALSLGTTHCHVLPSAELLPAGLKDEKLCNTCIVTLRVVSDYLCDFEFMAWATDQIEQVLCEAVPQQKEECEQVGQTGHVKP